MLNQIAQLLGTSYHGECLATERCIEEAIEKLRARIAELEAQLEELQHTRKVERDAGLLMVHEANKERDAARALAKEWEAKAMDAANHPVVQVLLQERDAAKAEAEERRTMAARAQEALRHLMNGLPTNDAVWAAYGNADSARAWLAERDAKMHTALEAARAGEARAVEALGTLNHAAKIAISTNYGNSEDEDTPLTIRLLDGTCDATDELLASTQPALDWLAQREREAAAEELERMCLENEERFGTHFLETTTDSLRDRAAALRAGKVQDAE
jgi:hypothetical protein